MPTEHTYIRSVHRYAPKLVSLNWKINDQYHSGVPDCFYEGDFKDLWCEYKYVKPFPKRPITLIDLCNPNKYLSKLQVLWLTRRYEIRGDTAVIAGCQYGGVIFWGDSWKIPIKAEDFKARCLPSKDIMTQIAEYVNNDWWS